MKFRRLVPKTAMLAGPLSRANWFLSGRPKKNPARQSPGRVTILSVLRKNYATLMHSGPLGCPCFVPFFVGNTAFVFTRNGDIAKGLGCPRLGSKISPDRQLLDHGKIVDRHFLLLKGRVALGFLCCLLFILLLVEIAFLFHIVFGFLIQTNQEIMFFGVRQGGKILAVFLFARIAELAHAIDKYFLILFFITVI